MTSYIRQSRHSPYPDHLQQTIPPHFLPPKVIRAWQLGWAENPKNPNINLNLIIFDWTKIKHKF